MTGRYTDAAYRKIFGTEVIRGLPKPTYVPDAEPPENQTYLRERLEVVLVVMSRWTERELMREDYNNATGICAQNAKNEPKRIFGVRVAYDDSLPDGEFLVSGELF